MGPSNNPQTEVFKNLGEIQEIAVFLQEPKDFSELVLGYEGVLCAECWFQWRSLWYQSYSQTCSLSSHLYSILPAAASSSRLVEWWHKTSFSFSRMLAYSDSGSNCPALLDAPQAMCFGTSTLSKVSASSLDAHQPSKLRSNQVSGTTPPVRASAVPVPLQRDWPAPTPVTFRFLFHHAQPWDFRLILLCFDMMPMTERDGTHHKVTPRSKWHSSTTRHG